MHCLKTLIEFQIFNNTFTLRYNTSMHCTSHSVYNRPVKRLTLVTRLPPALLYCTACWLDLWDSDAVFLTQNRDVG